MTGVDVAIPCYQYGRFLRDCVESVLSQGIDDLRILIIDNASTDDSVEVARSLAAAEPRVELLLRSSNLGPHASFNTGIDWARADYFMVLCADDLLTPGALARAVSILEKNRHVVFAYGTDFHCAEHDALPPSERCGGEPAWQIISGHRFIEDRCRSPERYIAAGMVLVRTGIQKKAGYYRPELPHTDDLEMLLRLARLGGVAFTAASQGIKRIHASNRTNQFLAERSRDLTERFAALESFFAMEGSALPDAGRLLRLGKRSLSERAYWCGIKDLCRGRSSAFPLLKLAVSFSPSVAIVPPLGYLFRMEHSLAQILADVAADWGQQREVMWSRASSDMGRLELLRGKTRRAAPVNMLENKEPWNFRDSEKHGNAVDARSVPRVGDGANGIK